MNQCQVDGCDEVTNWMRIETLEKPKIDYSFQIKTYLCALHITHLANSDEVGTHHSDEMVLAVPLTA